MRCSTILYIALLLTSKARSQSTDSTGIPVWAAPATNTLADTARIITLLDSARAWVGRGETERPVRAASAALDLIKAIPVPNTAEEWLNIRTMQANKLEGIAHHYAGRYAKALGSFQRMEVAAQALGREKDVAAALNYQGYQYRSMVELERARAITLRALRILKSLPEDGNLANTYSGLGTIYFDMARMDSALILQHQAVELHERLGYVYLAALCRMSVAEIHNRNNHFQDAAKELRLARPAVMKEGSPPDQVIFLYHEARAYMGAQRIPDAEASARQAMDLATQVGNEEYVFRSLELLALVASAQQQHGLAMELQDSSRMALVRSLDLAKAQELTEVRLTAEHEREAAKAQLILEAEKRKKKYSMIGGGLVALIAALLLWSLLAARRNAALLRSKNEEILRAQSQVVEVEKQRENEQVRTRIARDIHDDIGSGLTKITMLGNDAKRRLSDASEDLRSSLDRIIGHSREVSAALSDIVWTVDPLHDTSAELVSHARMVVQRLLDDAPIPAELHFIHNEPAHAVAPNTKHQVMMVLKEALNNAMKYGGGSAIRVEFQAGAHRLHLRVSDQGPGFDTEATGREGNGLRNMRKRAEAIGATLTVVASPGNGCTVELQASSV